jgi:hypothetical protein
MKGEKRRKEPEGSKKEGRRYKEAEEDRKK